ncbi:MAG: hypothetical protein WCP55_09765, partial [Lentisphaerota bacterium]
RIEEDSPDGGRVIVSRRVARPTPDKEEIISTAKTVGGRGLIILETASRLVEEEAKVIRAAGYDEAADVIEKMALTDPEGREELNDELRDIADNIQGEDWYKDMVVDYSEWGKVNFTDVGRLMKATDGHPVLPGLREYMAGTQS